jgi:tetratricopeptide (TPR) repeat protein
VGVKASIIADPNAALKHARQLIASDPKAAAKQARRLLESDPENPAMLRVLSAALRKLGQASEAARVEKQAVACSTRSPAHREAARALVKGEKELAVTILEGIISRDETDVVALVMLGLQMSTGGEYDLAEQLLRRAVEASPSDLQARLALSEHLLRAKNAAGALEVLDGIDRQIADSHKILSVRANILRDLGRQEDEVEILEKLNDTDERIERYSIRLGHAYRKLGRTAEAIAAYRRVIAKVPNDGTSWWALANMKMEEFDEADIAAMEEALGIPNASDRDRIRLHFALGKAHEDRKEIEQSFQHYDAGNRISSASSNYNPERIERWVSQAEGDFPTILRPSEGGGCQTTDPIFVIGLQRSGSTLVEQILDSHPMIEGTAELTELPAIARRLGDLARRRGIPFNELLRRQADDELRALGEEYLERTRVYRVTEKPHFTDKMPNNWVYTGLIRKILPNAKIVDVRRHPLDCCFSNWKQLYGRGLEHSYSMENMGRYYAAYVRLLRAADQTQPGKIHRVIYEHLVDDTEGEIRHLLNYLALPFDEACLNFHSNERSVRTISAEQVRQPINRRGISQWKPYEKWLTPLKTALGGALENWDK